MSRNSLFLKSLVSDNRAGRIQSVTSTGVSEALGWRQAAEAGAGDHRGLPARSG